MATNGVGSACRLKTWVSTVEKLADEAAGAVKAIEEGGSERKAFNQQA